MPVSPLVRSIGVPVVAGVAQLYMGALVAAQSVSLAIEHRFFGMDPGTYFAFDDYVIWGSVSAFIGAVVGVLVKEKTIRAAFLTCLVCAGGFALSAAIDAPTIDAFVPYFEPLIASLVFTGLGAMLAARFVRPNNRLEPQRHE